MPFGEKIIPLGGVNTDLHESLMPPNLARFIKNLVYEVTDTATGTTTKGAQTGVFKPTQSNSLYLTDFELPAGDNQCVGAFAFRELQQVFVFVYNSNQDHTVYRINGSDQTFDIVYQGPCLPFALDPQYFIATGGCWLEETFVIDPDTGEESARTFLMFITGLSFQCFICVEDSIATQSFDPNVFAFFAGNYDKCALIKMGVLTPSDCIVVNEVPATVTENTQNNRLLFNTWQFRLKYTDVWGRPSEHGIISELYIPGAGDCISASSGLPRCLDLIFDAPPPYIDKIDVEYRNGNSTQWYRSDTLNLYSGSPLGAWWLRQRNILVNFDAGTNTISYQFCADKACDPLPPAETNRLFNPIPRNSQSIAAIGNFIGVGNNVDGFNPFSQDLLDQVTFEIDPPSSAGTNNFRNVSILVEIVNFAQGAGPTSPVNGVVFLHKNQYWWQFLLFGQPSVLPGVDESYQQVFKNPNQQGFIGYFAGTTAFTISQQYSLDSSGVFEKVTNFTQFDTKKKYFQKFTFTNVKKGQYIFRIAGLTVDPAVDPTTTIFKSSTTVWGQMAFNINNPSNPVNHDRSQAVSRDKELVIDVCDGDYDSVNDNKILVIGDFAFTGTVLRDGYVLNTNDPTVDQFGIELMRLTLGYVNGLQTDHNGYYFFGFTTGGAGGGAHFNIYGYCNCQIVAFADNIGSGTAHERITLNFFLNQALVCLDYGNEVCNFVLIEGQVTLCGSGIGVPGVIVQLSRGASSVTDSDGNFSIIAHDDVLSAITGQPRMDKLYYITPTCPFMDCNGQCLPSVAVQFFPCVTCQARVVTVAMLPVLFIAARGLLSGGNYPVGLVGWDDQDRPTFVEQDPSYYLAIPSVQQTNIFAPSTVRVNIGPNAIFPPETKYLTFWIGTETTTEEYITWIIDSLTFIDNTGLENDITPTQIKIFYSSLVEYNKQNNFNTTVNWNFIPEGQSTPVVSDVVQFLLNGDGTFFPKAISALVKYDMTGQFFLINYTTDLAGLLPNAIIRLVRPKLCTGTEPYFEICNKIPVVNGKAVVSTFVLDAFDTYYINRQIPVPTLQPNSSPPVFINEPRIFGVPFESASPSDFWGLDAQNIGRVNTKNPYETVIFSPDQIALSGALAATGVNFLNYFDDAQKTDFGDTGINGIAAILPENNTILVLGQTDWFIVGFSDNLVRVNSEGVATAPSIDNEFGQPERKIGSNYGCMLPDKNTIYKKEGIVQFLDTSKAVVVQHNYQTAIPLSNNGAQNLIRAKIKAVQQYNLANGNKRYFAGVINPINWGYLLTDHIIGSASFINSLRDYDPTVQETFEFDIFSKVFKGMWSYTPEYFAELEGELNSQQLFSFVNGIPYFHYTEQGNPTFNTFYGTVCERILEMVIVMDNLKKKKPLALAEYCKQGVYFADRVVTETGQLSRILIPYFIQAEYGWYAPFLCDLNTPPDPNLPLQTGPNAILDGNMLTGTWIKFRLVGDPAINNQYSELQGVAIEVFPSEKSGV